MEFSVIRRRISNAVLIVAGLLGALVFTTILVASVQQFDGIWGVASGFFLATVVTLVFFAPIAVVAAWCGGYLRTRQLSHTADTALDDEAAEDLLRPLAGVLDELENTRQDIVNIINRRAFWRVPLCAVGGLLIVLFDESGESNDVFSLLSIVGVCGLIGYGWASLQLSERYRRMYKERVLPLLAARFGDVTYRDAVMPDMQRLKSEHIFREFDSITAEDELFGTYRGLEVHIVELNLRVGSGDKEKTIFDGLLVDIVLSRPFTGSTAIVADGGFFGNFLDWMARQGRQRIRLEDPIFERQYQVWGTDQIAARTLLTPAFMERFLALAGLPGFGRPLALARDNLFTVAMPKAGNADYFEPPSYYRPAANKDALLRLNQDVTAIFRMVDAVIDLDQSGRMATEPSAFQEQRRV